MFVKFVEGGAVPRLRGGKICPLVESRLKARWSLFQSFEIVESHKRIEPVGQWQKRTDRAEWWEYHETDQERVWANGIDQQYLRMLMKGRPDQFLLEMTPHPQHDGVCVGLDLKYPYHIGLQKEFQHEVRRICKEKGLTEHPALVDLRYDQLDTDGGSKETIFELQAKEQHKRPLINEKAALQEGKQIFSDQPTQSIDELQKQLATAKQKIETLQETVTQYSRDKAQLQKRLTAARNPRPSWLRVWEGKYTLAGEITEYEPVAAKVKGCAIGFIARTPKGKQYLAKLGLPDTDYEVAPSLSTRKRNLQRSIVSVITEKIGTDVYAVLGHGFYYVPKHRLARLKILNPFTQSDPHANAVIKKINEHCREEEQIVEGVHLLSRWMEQYRDIDLLEKCLRAKDDTEPKAFLDCLAAGYVPEYTHVEDHVVPILGLMELLAASRLLADTDVLGGGGKNAGFVVERDAKGMPMAVRVVKVDAGEAFNFSGEENQLTQSFNPISRAAKLKDPKDLQFGNQQTINIPWSGLADVQKNVFLQALHRGLALLRQEKLVDFFLRRRGEFDRAVTGERTVMIKTMLSAFKEAWLHYQSVQTMPQVYGEVITKVDMVARSDVPFRPKMYGAVNHQVDEAMQLSMGACGK